MRAQLVTALLCGALVTSSALAGQSIDPNLVPALHAGLSFGGPTDRSAKFDLALQMTYRGIFTQPLEPQRDAPLQFTPLSLDLIRLSGNRAGVQSAFVFSHDLLADYALDESDWRSNGIPKWIWWTAAGVAAAAATMVAVSSGGGDDSGDFPTGNPGPDNEPQGCDVVGGTIDIPDNIHPTVLSNCNIGAIRGAH